MILTVTPNPALDHTVQLDDSLEDGVVARTDRAQFDAGGKGINVSLYLTALKVETTATGFLGGHFGAYVQDRLDEEGVPTDFVSVFEETRVNTTVLTPDAEYKVNHSGPTVGEEELSNLVATVNEHHPDTVVVSGSLPPGLDTSAVDRLADGPWSLAVDMGGSFLTSLDGVPALCKPNREELRGATGLPVDTVDDCVTAVEALRERGYERVVASLGPDGALLASDSGTYHAPAPDVDVVDTVGAGDSLLAGVLAALDRGTNEVDALRLGIAVSTRTVGVPGTNVPDLTDVRASLDEISVQRR